MDDTQRQQYLKEALERAGAFEVLVNQAGWKFVQAYIENQLRDFTNKALKEGFKSMDEYQYARGVVEGLRGLLGNIQGDLETLNKYREDGKQDDSTK